MKDITQIKNVTQGICSSYGETPQTTSLRDGDLTGREIGLTQSAAETSNDAVKDSVPQSGEESNPQYSLKGTTVTKSYDSLLRENDAAQENIGPRTQETGEEQAARSAAAKLLAADAGELPPGVGRDSGEALLYQAARKVEGYNCTISAYEIQTILQNSHDDPQSEAARRQRQITAQDIELIPTIITSPDPITLGDRLYNGRPVILFSKTIDVRTTVVSYVSQKHMDLTVQTMYADKNKKSLATPPGEVSPLPHTSETLSGTALEDTIPQSGEESNPQYSLKGTTVTKSYDGFLRENNALREQLQKDKAQGKQRVQEAREQ